MTMTSTTRINRGGLTGKPFVSLYDAESERLWNEAIPFVENQAAESLSAFTNDNNASENPSQTADAIILARLPLLAADPNAKPCRRCGSLFRWRDCYSTTNLHCDKCNKPPSLAMVKQVFGLIEMNGRNGDEGFAWLDLTERIKPIMQSEQMRDMRAKRKSINGNHHAKTR